MGRRCNNRSSPVTTCDGGSQHHMVDRQPHQFPHPTTAFLAGGMPLSLINELHNRHGVQLYPYVPTMQSLRIMTFSIQLTLTTALAMVLLQSPLAVVLLQPSHATVLRGRCSPYRQQRCVTTIRLPHPTILALWYTRLSQ